MVNSESQKSPYTTHHKLYTNAKTLRGFISELVRKQSSSSRRREGFIFERSKKRGLKGFTLIELVVVIGVLSVLSAVAADMFINITRSYNKANIIAEIEQNGNLAISTMSNEIRSALSVSPTSGTVSSINIVDQDGAAVTFSFIAPTSNDNGYVARNGLPIIDNERVTGVNVTYGMFTIVEADPSVVGITMTITQPKGVPGRIDFQAETTLKTSVSLRSYK